jgi:protein TonB
MPGTMFQDVVSPQGSANRRWYTLPLSFAIHTAVLAVLVVVPLIATDALPLPRTALEYTMPTVMPVVEPPPIRRAVPNDTPSVAPSTQGVPLVAADRIGQETGLITEPHRVEMGSIDALFNSGFGSAAVDVLPLPAPVQTSEPLRAGVQIKAPARIKYVAPVYPEIARRSGVEGIVVIEAIINVEGRVENAHVLRSHPLLHEAALQAVRSWEYSPTLLNSRPTPVVMTVTVRFTLER